MRKSQFRARARARQIGKSLYQVRVADREEWDQEKWDDNHAERRKEAWTFVIAIFSALALIFGSVYVLTQVVT